MVIDIKDLGKKYRLGNINFGSLKEEIYSAVKKMFKPGESTASEKDFWALRDFNLSISEGEIVGIIGKNGAGKSTLLKMLSRVTTPTLGKICIKGKVSSLLEVGTGFHKELTGRENIFLNGAILGMEKSEIEEKLDDIIRFAGIKHHIDTPVKRYSSGMFVRLGFAVAAHLDADILIVDEVLAVGDMEFQRRAIQKIQDVTGNKEKTVLIVSHNLQTITNICSRVVILDRGGKVFDGGPQEAVQTYKKMSAGGSLSMDQLNSQSTGPMKISGIDVKNVQSNSEEVFVGDDFDVEVRFVWSMANPDYSYGNLKLSFQIHDENLQKLSTINNVETGFEIKRTLMESGRVRCRVKGVNFAPGSYFISFNAYNGNELLQSMDGFFEFKILARPLYGISRFNNPVHGQIVLDREWQEVLNSLK